MVELYFHSLVRTHEVMLNYLSTRTTLPLPYLYNKETYFEMFLALIRKPDIVNGFPRNFVYLLVVIFKRMNTLY
jgi:hypothetical protein